MARIGSGSSSIDWQKFVKFHSSYSVDRLRVVIGHSLCRIERGEKEITLLSIWLPAIIPPWFWGSTERWSDKRGVIHNASQWITEPVKKQHSATNNCRTYMCCIASYYVMALQNAALVDSPPIQAVEFHLRMNVEDCSTHARSPRAEAIQMLEVDRKILFWKRIEELLLACRLSIQLL